MAEAEKPPVTKFRLLGLLALLWSSSYYFAKIALVDLSPDTLAVSRVTLVTVFLLIVMRIFGDTLPRGCRTWRMLFIQACFNSILPWSILAWRQHHIDVALALSAAWIASDLRNKRLRSKAFKIFPGRNPNYSVTKKPLYSSVPSLQAPSPTA